MSSTEVADPAPRRPHTGWWTKKSGDFFHLAEAPPDAGVFLAEHGPSPVCPTDATACGANVKSLRFELFTNANVGPMLCHVCAGLLPRTAALYLTVPKTLHGHDPHGRLLASVWLAAAWPVEILRGADRFDDVDPLRAAERLASFEEATAAALAAAERSTPQRVAKAVDRLVADLVRRLDSPRPDVGGPAGGVLDFEELRFEFLDACSDLSAEFAGSFEETAFCDSLSDRSVWAQLVELYLAGMDAAKFAEIATTAGSVIPAPKWDPSFATLADVIADVGERWYRDVLVDVFSEWGRVTAAFLQLGLEDPVELSCRLIPEDVEMLTSMMVFGPTYSQGVATAAVPLAVAIDIADPRERSASSTQAETSDKVLSVAVDLLRTGDLRSPARALLAASALLA